MGRLEALALTLGSLPIVLGLGTVAFKGLEGREKPKSTGGGRRKIRGNVETSSQL